MMWLRQSTVSVINFGPVLDFADGNSLETGAGIITSLDHAVTGIMLSKNGGTLTIREQGANFVATTYDAHGCYKVSLSAIDTGTLGRLRAIHTEPATYLPVWQDFMVVPTQVWDSLFGADKLDVAVVEQANIDFGALQKTSLNAATPAVTVSDKAGFSLSATGADLILKTSTFAVAIAAAINELATYGLTALNTLLVTTGIKTATTAAPADMALNSTVGKEATLTTIAGYLDTEIAAILADTNELQTDWADGGRLDLILDGVSTGAGPTEWTYTLTEPPEGTGTPIPDADVWITTDLAGANTIASGKTNSSGIVTLYPDVAEATILYVWRQKAGYDFTNPDTQEVNF